MLTLLDAINLSTEYLKKKGIESPRINAELLLAHLLKCKRLELYLSFDRPLTPDETDKYREMIRRRGTREPLQYITGSVEFYGLEFKVNPSVLIPRPETEILVETVIQNVSRENKIKIIDIGTGSGIIPVSLAKNLPNAEITGVDISEDALKVAEGNSFLNKTEKNVTFFKHDIFNGYNSAEKYNILVSNPPYVSLNDFSSLEPELKVYEPKVALTDNEDGFSFYRIIAEKAKDFLLPKGKIFFEIGKDQSEKVKEILVKNNFQNIFIKKDYQNIERVISGDLN